MNTILDFIQSLQETKKSQLKWAATELPERAELLRKIAHSISENSQIYAQKISQAEGLPVSFVLENQIQPSIETLQRVAEMSAPIEWASKPTGLISVVLPRFFSFRILTERLAAALLAGNGAFVLTQNENGVIGSLWKELLETQVPVRIFHGAEDLLEIMCTHPAVQAVSFYGYPKTAEKILKSVSGTWKKWQITSGFHNSALILNDVFIPKVAAQLAESCFQGLGRLHWNTSNILVTEVHLEEFKKEFLGVLEERNFGPLPDADLTTTQEFWRQVREEKGQVLYGGEIKGGRVFPMVVQDLSHCSILQQDCLTAPLVLISPVKYTHEMVKWTNTSYFGMQAQIFAPEDKVDKFAHQLEVSRILANGWIESAETLPLGSKHSFSGIPDLSPFGSFFSDLRKIDRSQTRK